MKGVDIVLRFVPGYGWLYLLRTVSDGEELGRGEFKPSPEEALTAGLKQIGRLREQGVNRG